jgi:hypothetical protein
MAMPMNLLKCLVLLLLLLQLPFLYSVCQSRQLEEYLSKLPRKAVDTPPFRDLRGAVHVHSAAGGHSLGSYREIIEAAKQADFNYIFLTEHPREHSLFAKISDPELVIVYGNEEEREDSGRTLSSENSEVRILAYFQGLRVPDDVTGLEIFNMFETAKAAQNAFAWINWIYHKFTYEDLFFFHLLKLDEERFRIWDGTASRRHLAGVGGNDAHQNLGLLVQTTAGDRLLDIEVDPYLLSFQFLTNHLFVPYEQEPTQELVLSALQKGSSYIAFERIADPTGFSFHAEWQNQVFSMGEDVPVGSDLVLQSPVPSLFRVIRMGRVYEELEGTHFVFRTDEAGTYRLEVYPVSPPPLLENVPWIISNPIYVN